jgi:polysulfide reductase-like protein
VIDEKRLDEIRNNAQPLTPGQGYFGLPLLKPPVWSWEIPAYFFVGGTAGAAAVFGLAAQVTGADRDLVRHARWIAAAGAILSAPLLINDLGRPERFVYMLRVFKPQSAMSVGSWTLSAFGASATGAALFGESVLGNIAAAFAGATGLVMATYTGVLLGATSIPVWAKHVDTLPAHFAASAAASAASALQLFGHDDRALQAIGFAAAAFESFVGVRIETAHDPTLTRGATGLTTRIGGFFSGPLPLLLRLLGARSKRARQAAAASALLGSIITRVAWVEAGRKSANKYSDINHLQPQF